MTGSGTAERLVSAATDILCAEGAQAVTMRRVAAAAGVTAMAPYRHYRNREALLRSVADAAFAELGERWERRVAGAGFMDRYIGLLDEFLDFTLSRPHLYRFLITDRREGGRQFPDEFRAGESPTFSPVVRAVEQGMLEGVLAEDDPLEVTLAVTAQAQGLIQLYLNGRIGLPEAEFRALCRRSTERMLDGLRK